MSDDMYCVASCSRCGKSMGEVTLEEYGVFVFGGDDDHLCFDCDTDSASTVPNIFWQWEEGEVFYIGGQRFEVWALPGMAGELVAKPRLRTHEGARADGLSSSTYLNTDHQILVIPRWMLGVWKPFFMDHCPRCGSRDLVDEVDYHKDNVDRVSCEDCGFDWEERLSVQ